MSSLDLFVPQKRKTRSARNDKIAVQIRECIAEALLRNDLPIRPGHENESRLKAFVTITHVNVSPDLRNATILFVTANDEHQEDTLRFFDLQTYALKHILGKKLRLKYVPELTFKIDKSITYSDNIEKLLKQI